MKRTTAGRMPEYCFALLIWGIMLSLPVHVSAVVVQSPPLLPNGVSLSKGAPFTKADYGLNKVVVEYRSHLLGQPTTAFKPSNPHIRYFHGKVLVDAVALGDGADLKRELKGVGLQKGLRYGKVVSGWLPLGSIGRAVNLKNLRFISASYRPATNTGSVTGQGDAAMYADIARSLYDLSGNGVTVGVLSDSFDQLDGAALDTITDDLPSEINVLDDSANCGSLLPAPCSDEGRAMMQIIHDTAPGASLAFHTAFNGMAGFASGILDLATAGADVIVDDVIYFAEPMFQDGIIARAVDQVAADGVAYFSSAGNQADNSYEQDYQTSGMPLYVQDWLFGSRFVGILHDFDPGEAVDYLQNITVEQGNCAIISLQWDQPFGSLSAGNGSLVDLDIYLVRDDGSTLTILEKSDSDNVGGGEPLEILQFCNNLNTNNFDLMIAYFFEPDPGGGYENWIPPHDTHLKYVHFGALTVNEYVTNSATVYGHANAVGAEAVGASYYLETPFYSKDSPVLEYFSSQGGTPIYYDQAGQRLDSPIIRMKPEIIAPDGVDTTFFYPSSDRNNNGIPDFSGTSAAAPHAAAVAALMREIQSTATVEDIFAALETSAVDMEDPGFDFKSGYGLINADEAISLLQEANSSPHADFTSTINGLTVSFTDTSSDTDGNLIAWSWFFGDGNGSTEQNPSHTYPAYGLYNVSLTVTDNLYLSDTISREVNVSDPDQLNAPFNLNATVNDAIVALSWEDGSNNEDGFTIERAERIRGKFLYKPIAQIGPDTTSIEDMPEVGTYKYRVRSFRGSIVSDYSNEVVVKVETTPASVCGDGICGADENSLNCPEDCSPTPSGEICDDGEDNDGDGLIDCEDSDCDASPPCLPPCGDKGAPCTKADDCCSGVCRGIKCK